MKGILRSLVVVRDARWCVVTCMAGCLGPGHEQGGTAELRGWIVNAVRPRAYRARCTASRLPPRGLDAAHAAAGAAPARDGARAAPRAGLRYDKSPKKPRDHARPVRARRRAVGRNGRADAPVVARASITPGRRRRPRLPRPP
ncbi:hypothetical protein [Burkholderia glumae]|uniref:Uncharacterized protein n=1 Tax=Burkholderia glumae TaxID=337 RepID=A0AAP9Y2M7_BURGL|nr:hypothetical protein [Burkholderia glumae]MCM2541397.1 hypothetical protein [Burkholderia glumae]QPQ90495.1 hypothetical protein I6H06_01650 [Burkholderia glumae]QQM94325.1 hypothetical protein I6G78_21390 [Burkholderia glumae]USS43482.1 hypothetical protein NFI99_03170 [Burkholderia glumae]